MSKFHFQTEFARGDAGLKLLVSPNNVSESNSSNSIVSDCLDVYDQKMSGRFFPAFSQPALTSADLKKRKAQQLARSISDTKQSSGYVYPKSKRTKRHNVSSSQSSHSNPNLNPKTNQTPAQHNTFKRPKGVAYGLGGHAVSRKHKELYGIKFNSKHSLPMWMTYLSVVPTDTLCPPLNILLSNNDSEMNNIHNFLFCIHSPSPSNLHVGLSDARSGRNIIDNMFRLLANYICKHKYSSPLPFYQRSQVVRQHPVRFFLEFQIIWNSTQRISKRQKALCLINIILNRVRQHFDKTIETMYVLDNDIERYDSGWKFRHTDRYMILYDMNLAIDVAANLTHQVYLDLALHLVSTNERRFTVQAKNPFVQSNAEYPLRVTYHPPYENRIIPCLCDDAKYHEFMVEQICARKVEDFDDFYCTFCNGQKKLCFRKRFNKISMDYFQQKNYTHSNRWTLEPQALAKQLRHESLCWSENDLQTVPSHQVTRYTPSMMANDAITVSNLHNTQTSCISYRLNNQTFSFSVREIKADSLITPQNKKCPPMSALKNAYLQATEKKLGKTSTMFVMKHMDMMNKNDIMPLPILECFTSNHTQMVIREIYAYHENFIVLVVRSGYCDIHKQKANTPSMCDIIFQCQVLPNANKVIMRCKNFNRTSKSCQVREPLYDKYRTAVKQLYAFMRAKARCKR